MGEPKKIKSKLTDSERHRRFIETAKKVEASERIEDFDRAFDSVVTPSARRSRHNEKQSSS
jgi:hypothetical protein